VRGGEVVGFTPWQPQLIGEVSLSAVVPAIPSGRYEVRIAAGDGVDVVRTAGKPVRVRGGSAMASPSPSASPTGGTQAAPPAAGERNLGPTLIVLGASAFVLLALLVLTMRRRKGLHRRA
jgi:hypothetical protein